MMKTFLLSWCLLCFLACNPQKKEAEVVSKNQEVPKIDYNTEVTEALRYHLDVITAKDIEKVKQTLPAENETMHLILPDGTQMNTGGEFIKMHDDWFKDSKSEWSLTFTIKFVHATEYMGYALVEALLEEPERDGKPYFHRMHVSYVLEKVNSKWLVIKDHASTIDKSA